MRLYDARRDYYRKLAKDHGYRSRSAYKLEQLNKSYRILKPSYKVIDFGCAPGGWLQVILKEVGSIGKVVGVDIQDIKPIHGAIILHVDIEDDTITDSILRM